MSVEGPKAVEAEKSKKKLTGQQIGKQLDIEQVMS